MRRPFLYGALVVLALGAGAGAAVAAPGAATTPAVTAAGASSQLSGRIQTLETQAAATHNTRLLTALQSADAALHTSLPPLCPPTSPNGGNGQPCGKDHNGSSGGSGNTCPPTSPNGGNGQPCGKDHNGGSGGGGGGGGSTPPPACGPADQGGTAPTGPVTSQLYNIGEQISNNGGAPLGDAVQSIACAVNGATGL